MIHCSNNNDVGKRSTCLAATFLVEADLWWGFDSDEERERERVYVVFFKVHVWCWVRVGGFVWDLRDENVSEGKNVWVEDLCLEDFVRCLIFSLNKIK